MEYRQLGNSGLKVSEIALGSWLTYGKTVEDTTAEDCIRLAYEKGINFFDTANVYEQGQAEKVLGKVLKEYDRDKVVVATKVYFPMGDGPNDRGLSRKHIIEQCDRSLQRLGMDYVDLYQCHRFDPTVPLEETIMALEDLVKQGKVLYTGVSEWSAAQIEKAQGIIQHRGYHKMVSNQPVYNLLQRYIEKEVLPVSESHGMGQIVFSPLAQGVLTGKYKPNAEIPKDSRAANKEIGRFVDRYMDNETLEAVQKIDSIADQLDLSLVQLSLAWILRQPGVSSAIIGASKPSQIEENVQASGIKLSQDVLDEIDKVLEEIAHIRKR
ncbi:aldo/keto reductase family protein [Marinilactibacillus psychrotolerans]|uniref:Aldo/keto family dehydrogenase n=2 Tax=Marinilactibacillus psychrotolerans TaxID=191770 RepID=A0AAV3WUF4_9LACT|nr:aldo/keto reductase family protein [Marinilactibacillus psychrotolerans]GEL67345.1 aldo/keto reductase [Marinilactibacillus psychrotolerans]GEQ36288.1 aldo/keto family dehydrogenase [Marinilactibacillus psychrotolerans]SDC93897.1 voltage-dependent potassium channel beta subunit, animal [Marinilactibacillus psychrotolerans]